MPPTPRPTWQIDECPSWCQQEHSENDHPDDRKHQTLAVNLPVIALFLRLDQDEELVREPEATDMVIAASRRDGETTTWLYIGEGPGQHIEVSLESGQRISEELTALVRQLCLQVERSDG